MSWVAVPLLRLASVLEHSGDKCKGEPKEVAL